MYYQRVAKCKRSQWPRINCWIRQASFHGDILKFGTCFSIHEKEYDSEILFLKILSPIALFSTMESIELIIFRYRQCFDQLTLNTRSKFIFALLTIWKHGIVIAVVIWREVKHSKRWGSGSIEARQGTQTLDRISRPAVSTSSFRTSLLYFRQTVDGREFKDGTWGRCFLLRTKWTSKTRFRNTYRWKEKERIFAVLMIKGCRPLNPFVMVLSGLKVFLVFEEEV